MRRGGQRAASAWQVGVERRRRDAEPLGHLLDGQLGITEEGACRGEVLRLSANWADEKQPRTHVASQTSEMYLAP